MPQITAPLRYLYNWSIETGQFPRVWREAKLCPISKNSKELFSPENSRSNSLLPTLSKILESIISTQIWSYMETNDLISVNQHAYRKNHSTATALIEMTEQWLEQIDVGNYVGVLFLVFMAAFDLVDHNILLKKLFHYGFQQTDLD